MVGKRAMDGPFSYCCGISGHWNKVRGRPEIACCFLPDDVGDSESNFEKSQQLLHIMED
jgi:hypothetical protein